MDRAATVIVDALVEKRRVYVFADYDVDGGTSAAQLVRWFRAMGSELPIYVPDRMKEGLAPAPPPSADLREAGAELVITVDCGAAAYDALIEATRIGLEVVVIDHHLMHGETPPCACTGQSQPSRRHLGAGHAGGRRRDLRAARRAQSRGAQARLVRRACRA